MLKIFRPLKLRMKLWRKRVSYFSGNAIKPKKLIHRILLTGGPCAGKSTALSTIQQFLMNHGFTVYTIPEASKLLQMNGAIKLTMPTLPYFQNMVTSID